MSELSSGNSSPVLAAVRVGGGRAESASVGFYRWEAQPELGGSSGSPECGIQGEREGNWTWKQL